MPRTSLTRLNLLEGYNLEPIDGNVKIVKKNGWFFKALYLQKAFGASFPCIRVWLTLIGFAAALSFLLFNALFLPIVYASYLSFIFLAVTIFLSGHFVLAFTLHFLRVIIIRKECYACQLGFHIIEHEKTHLKLNSLDDDLVDKETLKQTGSKLFPIILSKPTLCKDCGFTRKKYLVAATAYAEEKKQSAKP